MYVYGYKECEVIEKRRSPHNCRFQCAGFQDCLKNGLSNFLILPSLAQLVERETLISRLRVRFPREAFLVLFFQLCMSTIAKTSGYSNNSFLVSRQELPFLRRLPRPRSTPLYSCDRSSHLRSHNPGLLIRPRHRLKANTLQSDDPPTAYDTRKVQDQNKHKNTNASMQLVYILISDRFGILLPRRGPVACLVVGIPIGVC